MDAKRKAVRVWLGVWLASVALAAAPDFRLPEGIAPLRYRLDLTVLPDRPAFEGRVVVDVRIKEATRVIWMNGKDLTSLSGSAEFAGLRHPARVEAVGGEFLSLTFDDPIGPGAAQITIGYTARLDDKLSVGAYRRRDGKDWYAFTTFTPIEARRAFPCFDQPEFKTPWKISMHVRTTDMAVSNARQSREVAEGGDRKRVEFEETKPIATEVVAFAVGPFEAVDDGKAGRNQIPVRLLTPRGRGAEARGALGMSSGIIESLEAYTGIAYPWDKLDHLAVLDMPFGAVENPGLITYKDRGLLSKADVDTAERRNSVRGTMAHELAHQWFGNLVTQRWWNDVWLSEGFATFMALKLGDAELPEYQRGVAAVKARGRVMTGDDRPVRVEMHSRAEMQDVYSRIVYQKGGAVLAMVEHWLGAGQFRDALRLYLQKHAYGPATTGDLAAAIRESTGVDVTAVLHSYLDQAGFPLVRSTIDCESKKLIVEQESKLKWSTPVCVRETCTVVTGERAELPAVSCPGWVWPNASGAGYYRSQTRTLAQMLDSGWNELTAAERLSVAQDLELLPAEEQLAALPQMLADRDANVVAAAQRVALRLATAPGAPMDAIRELLK